MSTVGLKDHHHSSLLVLALAVADKQSYENDGWHRLCPYSERSVGIDVASSLEAAPNHGHRSGDARWTPGPAERTSLACRAPGPAKSHLSELGGTASARALTESL